MAEGRKFEYFLVRYVPSVLREEFVNIGLVMTEAGDDGGGFGGLHFTSDWRRARSLDPNMDVEWLEALGRDVRRRLEDVQQRPLLLHEIMDSCSNSVQVSAVRQTIAEDPEKELRELAAKLVEMPTPEKQRESRAFGRRWLHSKMVDAFETAGVLDLLNKDVPVKTYTNESDDFTIDFGYAPNPREFKLFHAVSLVDVGIETRMFPLRVAKIAPKMAALRKVEPRFTAVVEDMFDEEDRAVKSVLAFMKAEEIRVARVQEIPTIAGIARQELRA